MQNVLEKLSTIRFQVFFLILSLIILFGMVFKPIIEFNPVGKEPSVKPIDAQTINQGDKKPIIVHTGFSITDFIKFDTIKNEFIVNAILWFAYDPEKIKLETLEKFTFTKGEIIKKSDPIIQKKSENMHVATYYIRVQFGTILDYSRFPLDDHRLFLNLTNYSVDAREVIFEVAPQEYTVDKNVYISGWQLVGHQTKSGYSENIIGTQKMLQPKVIFSLDISKQDVRQLLLIVLPLLFIFYFSIFAFSIKDVVLAVTLILASISGLLAYAFVIQTISPNVGYFMLSDYLFVFVISSIFIIFLITILYAAPEHIASKHTLATIKGIAIPLLYVFLIIIWYYLLFIKDIT